MRIYAISDLHLSAGTEKPMDIFGSHWVGHYDAIRKFWQENIRPEDYVLHCGDFCWAMKLCEAEEELRRFAELPGKKVMIRGNHDLWWTSLAKMKEKTDESIIFIQNSSMVIDDDEKQKSIILCGTRGWAVPGSNDYTAHDEKIYRREILRLRMSLDSAKKLSSECRYPDQEFYVMLHYPPIPMYGAAFENRTELNDVLCEYGVNKVIFGHVHKPQQVKSARFEKYGIEYILSSCDMIDNYPVTVY